ncbi:MAG: histidine triad nucleotide-binding protein [Microbacteriaceae bacterium]|jgi:histidine triad (HIT) family protein
MSSDEPSIFTRIINREIPAEIVFEDDRLIAINDINPQAPVHLLVIPKTQQYHNVSELADADPDLLSEMINVARSLAREHANGEFRLIFNSGVTAGQTVFHVHAHVLAGDLQESSLV